MTVRLSIWVLLTLIVMCGGATAQFGLNSGNDPFSALVDRPAKKSQRIRQAEVERFVTASRERVFLLERRGDVAKIRFLCAADDPRIDCAIDDDFPAEEIFSLTASRAPRGDTIYRDAAGRPVVRLTPYGNATVYWPGEEEGSAATRTFGEDPLLDLTPVGADVAHARAQRATALVSAAVGGPIIFAVEGVPIMAQRPQERVLFDAATSASSVEADIAPARGASIAYAEPYAPSPTLADAVARTAAAVTRIAADDAAARIVAKRINRIEFSAAETPSVRLADGVLTVRYRPNSGIDGRLGSTAIAAYLEDAL